MIGNIFTAIMYTFAVVVAIVLTIATLYITMWLIVGVAIVMLVVAIYRFQQAKDTL